MKRGLGKVAALFLTVALVCGIGIGALAAGSPALGSATGTDANGNTAEIIVSPLDTSDAEISEAVEMLNDGQTLVSILGDDYTDGMVVADVREVTVQGDVVFPVTITFEYPGITANTKAALLHWNGSEWEKIPTVVGDGTITGTFESLSPVAVIIDTSGESGVSSGSGSTGTTGTASGTTSPKTGEDNSLLMFAGVTAVIALAGVCVLKNRKVIG